MSKARSSLSSLFACPEHPRLQPWHRDAWAPFLGALFGVCPTSEGARAAVPTLRALLTLALFIRGVFAVLREARAVRGSLRDGFRDGVVGALEAQRDANTEHRNERRLRAALVAFWVSADMCDVVSDACQLDPTFYDDVVFLRFVRRALRIARELARPRAVRASTRAPHAPLVPAPPGAPS